MRAILERNKKETGQPSKIQKVADFEDNEIYSSAEWGTKTRIFNKYGIIVKDYFAVHRVGLKMRQATR